MKPTGKTHKKAKKIKQPSEPRGCIYLLTNLTNGGKYVGQDQTSDPENHRWKQHKKDALAGRSTYPLHRAMRKAHDRDKCWKGFKFEIIWHGPVSRLNWKETYYIKKLHTYIRDPLCIVGYNLTLGGEGCRGYKHTKAVKKRHSALMTALWSVFETRTVYTAAFNTPECKAALSTGQLRRYELMTAQEKVARSKAISIGNKRRFKAKAECEKASASAVRRFEDKSEREKLSAAAIQRFVHATPKQRVVWTKAIKDGHQTPQAKAKSSKGTIAFWAKMMPAERKAYWRKNHPNGNKKK